MSFASETKNELARIEPEKKCCMLAEIAAYIRTAGSIGLVGGGRHSITLTTDNAAVARHFKKLVEKYFDIDTNLEIYEGGSVGRNRREKRFAYSIMIDPENHAEAILRECGIILIREGRDYYTDGIYDALVKSKCDKRAYLRGAFLGSGTMSNPDKSYHLEFVLNSEDMANDLRKLINSFSDLTAKVVRRGKKYIVYMKKADYISDTLALMGASGQVLKLEDTRIRKEMLSSARRAMNCDNANVDRVIDASMKQVEAISLIAETKGLNWLDGKLMEVALLRLEHPEASIAALGEMCDPPLKKSGVNNRLRKIEELAARLRSSS
ncbi:MAG: DNA-binding protein WhiA [Firmicutes bacterium]|nr:DNA-binding protein WhiA [Bacillota bacterium]